MGITKIAILGGGISGLSLLHFLKKKHSQAVKVTLYERQSTVGGHIRTISEDGFCFETGPNGFLSNQPQTLSLIADLGLNSALVAARPSTRFVQISGRLHPVPAGVGDFLKTGLLSWPQKASLIAGFFNKNVSTDQSVYDYAAKRFGPQAAKYLADPFVSGVFAGDAKRLHMQSAFGKMLEKAERTKKTRVKLLSLQGGMGQLVDALAKRYAAHIKTNAVIGSLNDLDADRVYCTVPAYSAAALLTKTDTTLSELLDLMIYAPVVVVGLGFDATAFKRNPLGFGYLIPSYQNKSILGVLIESNVFEGRAPKGKVMIRVMMGGRHHPNAVNEDMVILKERAEMEINQSYGLQKSSIRHWVKIWPKAIPQYELDYPKLVQAIGQVAAKNPRLRLAGNYLGGVAFNDAVANAAHMAEEK